MAAALLADRDGSVADICRTLGVSRSTLYRLKEKGQPLPEVKPAGIAAPKTSGHRHQAQSVSRIKTSPLRQIDNAQRFGAAQQG